MSATIPLSRLILTALTLLLSLSTIEAVFAAEPSPATEPRPDKCLTKEEADLASKINKLRADNKLSPLPVSKSLYTVAKWHVIDLSLFAPHENKTDASGKQCDLHSWSDKGAGRGEWKPLCYTSDHKYALEMFSKPREIANYMANGYENIYWTSAPLTSAMTMNGWENKKDEKDLILQQGNFKRSRWTSIGIGMNGNYASAWFGEGLSNEEEISVCGK